MDFNLMISKNQDDMNRQLSEENASLKNCFKMLQKELFDIVDLKCDTYLKRFKAEMSDGNMEIESEEIIKAEINKIRDELFNMNFLETQNEIVRRFQDNFQKLKDFMERIDKDIAQLAVFNLKEDQIITDDPTSKFSGITSIQ